MVVIENMRGRGWRLESGSGVEVNVVSDIQNKCNIQNKCTLLVVDDHTFISCLNVVFV